MNYGEFKNTKQHSADELLNKHEVFFAFTKEQLMKNKKENVKYYSLDGGMFIPQENYEQFLEDFNKQEDRFIEKAKELFSPCEIIKYELANHEYCYTYDMTDTKEVLEGFNFSEEDFMQAKKEYLAECEEF